MQDEIVKGIESCRHLPEPVMRLLDMLFLVLRLVRGRGKVHMKSGTMCPEPARQLYATYQFHTPPLRSFLKMNNIRKSKVVISSGQ